MEANSALISIGPEPQVSIYAICTTWAVLHKKIVSLFPAIAHRDNQSKARRVPVIPLRAYIGTRFRVPCSLAVISVRSTAGDVQARANVGP